MTKNYDSHFNSANFDNETRKTLSRNRRHYDRIKKTRRKNLSKYSEVDCIIDTKLVGTIVDSTRKIVKRIPLTYYDEYWNVNFIYDYDYIIEEVPYKKHIYEKVSIKPYVKRFSISNRRKFAKNRTNKIIRHTKLNTLASNPSYYRRVFDYAYEIW